MPSTKIFHLYDRGHVSEVIYGLLTNSDQIGIWVTTAPTVPQRPLQVLIHESIN